MVTGNDAGLTSPVRLICPWLDQVGEGRLGLGVVHRFEIDGQLGLFEVRQGRGRRLHFVPLVGGQGIVRLPVLQPAREIEVWLIHPLAPDHTLGGEGPALGTDFQVRLHLEPGLGAGRDLGQRPEGKS